MTWELDYETFGAKPNRHGTLTNEEALTVRVVHNVDVSGLRYSYERSVEIKLDDNGKLCITVLDDGSAHDVLDGISRFMRLHKK